MAAPNPELAALPNLFLLNPKNRAFVDGTSRWIEDSRQLRFLSPLSELIVVFLFSVFAFLAIDRWNFISELARAGVITQGTVTERHQQSCGDGVRCYSLTYRFSLIDQNDAPAVYTATSDVDYNTYLQYSVESPIEVTYLQTNPLISRIPGNHPQDMVVAVAATLLALVHGVGMLLIFGRKVGRMRRTGRLLAKGRLLNGEVINWWMQKQVDDEGKSFYYVELRYMFRTPLGHKIKALKIMKLTNQKMIYTPFVEKPGTPSLCCT